MRHDVTFTRSEYNDAMSAWDLVDDVCEGQEQVKSKTTLYLPQPNPEDNSNTNRIRYEQYVLRAVFLGATGRTLQGMVGAAFSTEPTAEMPSSIRYVEEDVDGAGVALNQQARDCLKEVLKKGRMGLLVDYPRVEGPVSIAAQNDLAIRATILTIDPTTIVNWRTEKVGATHKLVLLVIKETESELTEDGFGSDDVTQYRVLKLVDGIYTQTVYRKSKDKWTIHDGPHTILNGDGSNWEEIPFTFVGANNNDTIVDKAPLYDMAEVNIAHYRNSADYEDSVYFCGQVQPWMNGLSTEWRDYLEDKGIFVGSRAPILLPTNGNFGMEQAQPNSLAKEAMDQKENQLVALGARLITPGTVAKTATETKGDISVQHSVLSLVASNVSDAYEKALGWVADFMKVTGNIEYALTEDLAQQDMTPDEMNAWVGAVQAGLVPKADFWRKMKKVDNIDPDKTDEDIQEELDEEAPDINMSNLFDGGDDNSDEEDEDQDGDITATS